MRLRYWLLIAAGVCVATGIWWDTGGQHWAVIQTGTNCGSTGVHYCYWSGFGSVMPWVLAGTGGILAILYGHIRIYNCHVKGCPRVGRFPVADGSYRLCGHHNPDFKGKHPTLDHILEQHRLHNKKAGHDGASVQG